MARNSGHALGSFRLRNRDGAGPRHPLARALHHLGNNINSLALRLYVLQRSDLSTGTKTHVNAAHRVVQQSMRLLEEINEMVEVDAPPPLRRRPGPPATAPRRTSRK